MTSQPHQQHQLLVSLTEAPKEDAHHPLLSTTTSPSRVGGKASSLAKLYATAGLSSHVPKAYALSVDFFQPWIDELKESSEFQSLVSFSTTRMVADDDDHDTTTTNNEMKVCTENLQRASRRLDCSTEQQDAVQTLVQHMQSSAWNAPQLAAVRSSAPEEDGDAASFAGAFETELGVAADVEALLRAIRNCFASLWDYRVLDYKLKQASNHSKNGNSNSNSNSNTHTQRLGGGGFDDIQFAVVVMEMIDSIIAGVAFTANPLNSDRDEVVIDSSYGLGESVVDGSVTADRYIVDKLDAHYQLIKQTIGVKGVEKRLGKTGIGGGGVVEHSIDKDDKRRTESSLSKQQLEQLSKLVCVVEDTYGMPMDVEWAFVDGGGDESNGQDNTNNEQQQQVLELKLLQARPITTLYTLDKKMMTKPGEQRVLYMDGNIMSEATTTNPFTTMDLDFFCKFVVFLMGVNVDEMEKKNITLYSESPSMPMFNSSTRQYANMSLCFKYFSPETFAKMIEMIDPYSASIFKSTDCERTKYRTKKLPKGCGIMDAYRVMREFPLRTMRKTGKKFKKDPATAKESYVKLCDDDTKKLKKLVKERESGKHTGTLKQYSIDLCHAIFDSIFEGVSAIFFAGIMDNFKTLDKKRRDESLSKEERDEYDHLLGGYIGDGIMEVNIAIYNLAQKLPIDVWDEYDHKSLKDLATRIEMNLNPATKSKSGSDDDLPTEFLDSWVSFMDKFGFDGQDQLFMSCPRYQDSPELLLSMLRMNAVGDNTKDPSQIQKEQVDKRRVAQLKQENDAEKLNKFFHPFALSSIKKRNEVLEHVMWIRNAPKL